MKKVNLIMNFVCIPFIILQWHFKYVWLTIDYQSIVITQAYWISLLYFIAYFLLYKNHITASLVMMWSIFLVLTSIYSVCHGMNWNVIFISIDLWQNLISTFLMIYLQYKNRNLSS